MNNNYELLKRDDRKTLSDAQTKLYIKAENDIFIIKVDNGIFNDDVKKCDYLAYREKEVSNFIELKGSKIDKAYIQIIETIKNISNNDKLKHLIDIKELKAYIISKEKNKIPNGIENKSKELAKILYDKSKIRPNNMIDLVKYVLVVSDNDKRKSSGNRIICSSKHPLIL
ncbi:hypothetical protein JQ824_07240 [Brachyspira hyodysenteriae]|uniref:Uncharacterized protein n=1 Tax=Brachyspira hyodysenteriae (strain ATCC 49526 / WA1) TaxID=565034 RepID=A0A3B6VGF7_BRAHW|nr:hypothetical protein [Brachyspira hyodysenteriae]ACN84871.1 hypothetical protein BHWA1_02417 [Brachyspira hyodysenteriae WA1]KLI16841.1 hypothetical protein SU44_05650 [Brachyspira hyodysenteriae]KLI31325.1 hypothetical protein SZ50_11525 [Brachyspira hyodysenteriae]KLI42870.1 hypothetical protein SZ40_09535 [Brachyspira hyodysenteriae]MBT8719891.1 hypothetical protein [Brachyspira hyodysenteriae]